MKQFVYTVAVVLMYLFFVQTGFTQQNNQYDIVFKGGHVIDPANNINRVMDVAVKDGKIARVAGNIPPEKAGKAIDIAVYYITPGIIDIHTHIFYDSNSFKNIRSVIPDDVCPQSGCTTVVDAGTPGADTFEDFKYIHDTFTNRTRVFAFINIAAPGMGRAEQNPLLFDVQKAVAMARKYPDMIVGFKTAHYWGGESNPYDEIHTPWASVDSVLAAGKAAGLPVMFDVRLRPPQDGYPARSFREHYLVKARPGDIQTHCFGKPHYIIREDGTVNPDYLKARERGIVFDVGHGAGAFWFRNAVRAVKQGFLPHSISTDLHLSSVAGSAINMTNVMSKFLCMGVPLEDVIRRSTVNPARVINHPELGTMSEGSTADIAILELLTGNFSYTDVGGGKLSGDRRLNCVMTLFGGRIVYDPTGLNATEWSTIPKDSPYWDRTTKQNY
ncbi:amidohydrolase/deacetylase family metallohydrolase [Candidatus Latescibacterota bacterium]